MISMLYKIGDEVVFYSPSLNSRRTELYQGLLDGSIIGTDCDGIALPVQEAVNCLCTLCDRVIGVKMVDKILANITLAPVIVSIVRAEMINLPVDQGTAVLTKLLPVINALNSGMFNTASQMLKYTITVDEFLTRERLDRYASMLISADAIH